MSHRVAVDGGVGVDDGALLPKIDDLSDDDPVLIFTHIVCPRLNFADRGKGALLL